MHLAKYIEMAWWMTFFYPFFFVSYVAYFEFARTDLDEAKAILKTVELWDDVNASGNKSRIMNYPNKPTLFD